MTETKRLELSVDACKKGLSIHESSRTFRVSYSVLQRRVAGIVDTSAGLGCKPVLRGKREQQLHDHILKLADLGFGIDWRDIKALAVRIAAAAGIGKFSAGGG